jgi:hypothetical protein
MGRLIRLVLILFMGIFAAWPVAPLIPGPAGGPGKEIPLAVVENHQHLAVLRLQGTPYEMGYQHGVARRAAIRQLLEEGLYGQTVLGSGQSHGILLAHARQLERGLPVDIQRELHGIADGAGLSYEDILLLNLVLNRLPSLPLAPIHALPPPPALNLQALVFAAWPPAIHRSEGVDGTLLGCRLDVPNEAARLRRHLLAVIYQPADGQAYATVTWSGQVGAWCGLNEASLAICTTPAEGGDPGNQELSPAILSRQLLARAHDGEQALRQAIQHDYVSTFRLFIADGRRQLATTIVFGAHRYDIIESQTGLVAFGSDWPQLVSLLERNLGWLRRDKALAALSSPRARGEDTSGLCGESTLVNVLFAPGRGELWVGLDLWPASCRRYLHLRLAGGNVG